MKLFSEKVTPTFTNSNYNVLTLKDYNEVFFDVYELEINGNKYITEKVFVHNGDPVVNIPVVYEGKKLEVLFTLQRGNFNVAVNSLYLELNQNSAVGLSYDDDKSEQEEIEAIIFEKKESILKEIQQARKLATQFAEDIKRQKIQESVAFINAKEEAITDTVDKLRGELIDDFLHIVENTREEFYTYSEQEKKQTTKFISRALNDLSKKLENGITRDITEKNDKSVALFKQKICELAENILSESLIKEIEQRDEIKNKAIDAKFETVSKSLSKILNEQVGAALSDHDKAILSLEQTNVELNNNILKSSNKALSRIGSVKTQLETVIADSTVTLLDKITLAEDKIKNYYDERINLIEGSIISNNKEYFIELIKESKQSILDEVSQIKSTVPSVIVEKTREIKGDVDVKSIKTDLEKTISNRFTQELANVRRIIEMSSGGGSVAVQFANGGTMRGNLNVVGDLSATGIIYNNNFSSLNWNDTYTVVSNTSANWNNVYASVRATSANWDNTYTSVSNTSANWNNVYSSVRANSANWNNVYSSVRTTSANWDNTYTSVRTTSANWNNVYASVRATSSNWNNTYTSVSNTSANWNNVYSSVRATSANWNNTYTSVSNTSANWNNAYTIASSYQTVSSTFATIDYTNSTFFALTGGTITGDTKIKFGDLTVFGNISATGSVNYANTFISTTSSLCVFANTTYPIPGLYVAQAGTGDIATFYDVSSSREVFHIGGSEGYPGIGVNTSFPNKDFTVVGDISATGIIYNNNYSSNDWNSAYSNLVSNSAAYLSGVDLSFLSVSANWDNTYTSVSNTSANWNNTYTSVSNTSANWDNTYTSVSNTSANWDSAYSNLISNSGAYLSGVDLSFLSVSANWNNTYTSVSNTSANWDNAYSNLVSNSGAYLSGVDLSFLSVSANWNNTYTSVSNTSANWDNTYTSVQANSSIWDNAYSNLISNSGAYLSGADLSFLSVSANWNNTYTSVQANSSNWDNTYTSVSNTSANWDNAYSNLISNSGAYLSGVDLSFLSVSANWNNVYTSVSNTSANWDNTYTSVQANSSIWDNAYSNLVSNSGAYLSGVDLSFLSVSANWNNTYTSVQANSANWDNAYSNLISNSGAYLSGVDLGFLSVSANWNNTYTSVQANSSNWNSAYSNLVSNSAAYLSGVDLSFLSVSANWNNVYTSVSNTSANWDSAYSNLISNSGAYLSGVDLGFLSVSANWNNTYTSVQANSSNWNNTYTSVQANSSNWDNTYTSVQANSSNWDNTYTSVSNTSANWNNTYTSVQANSSNWDSAYSNLVSNSAAYLSGVDLGFLSVSANWNNTYTSVSNTSANWDSAYTIASTYQTTSSTFATIDYTNSTFFTLTGGTITGDTKIRFGDLTVFGNISATGTINYANTFVSTTTSLCALANSVYPIPGLYISQAGTGDIATFYDVSSEREVLHIGGSDGYPGVGVNTSFPNKDFTVVGDISATGIIYNNSFNSNNWNDTYTTVQANSATTWNYQGDDLKALSGNWQSTYNNLSTYYPLTGGTLNGSISATGNIITAGTITASGSDVKINIINVNNSRIFTDADNNKVVHLDTTTASLCAIFPDTLSAGFNVAIMNVGTNTLVLSAAQLNSAGTTIVTKFGGAFVYKDSASLFAVGRLI